VGHARGWITLGDQRVEEYVLQRLGLANLFGALLSFAIGELTNPPHEGAGYLSDNWGYSVAFVVYMAALCPVCFYVTRRTFRQACGWLAEGREPTEAERRAVLALPWRETVISFGAWLGASALFGILNLVWEPGGVVEGVRTALFIVLSGLSACALVYLLVERGMRPVYARALAAHEPWHRPGRFGIAPRLLLSWALGSAVPLLVLGLAYMGRPPGFELPAATMWFVIGAGVVTGGLAITAAARSVADPIEGVRDAMGRVQGGDLDVALPVDDGGEVGMLQSGFNRMVEGLRERRQLRDLFGRHVGAHVAQQALERGATLGGERREVSVLFADVVGSTALAQSRPPDEVVAMLNDFFAAVVRRVGAEGGWVNKFEGDGAMCVFGAPADQAGHADRALRACRLLRRDVLELSMRHPGFDAAVAVSSGTVVAGNVGSEERFEYTVIGDPVNEASRLADEAKHHLGRALASEEAVERSGGEARHWQVAGELALRGRRRPTLAYAPSPDAVEPVDSLA
jgi:adenylate cyclase